MKTMRTINNIEWKEIDKKSPFIVRNVCNPEKQESMLGKNRAVVNRHLNTTLTISVKYK